MVGEGGVGGWSGVGGWVVGGGVRGAGGGGGGGQKKFKILAGFSVGYPSIKMDRPK